jgi:hypothetical protein
MRSIRLLSLLLLIGVLATSLPLTVVASPANAPQAQTNFLQNPSFENGFTNGVGNSWSKWAIFNANATPQTDCGRKDPGFQQITSSTDTRRVKDGSNAQQIIVPVQDPGFGFYGGLQQTVNGLTAGKTYRFTIWAHAWSSTADNAASSQNTGPAYFEVGVANGSTYAADPNIKRSGVKDIKDNYQQLSVDITATGGTITVFTYANPSSCSKHNEAFFDAGSLTEVGGSAAPTNAPGSTNPPPAQPTATLGTVPTRFPTPTANAQGQVVYTVQSGDTITRICGVVGRGNDPACIDDIVEWNGLSSPRALFVGQQLIIAQPGGSQPAATVAPTETAAATADPNQPTSEATAGGEATTDPNAEPTTDPGAQPTEGSGQPTATPAGAASICVTLYNDANGNGVLDPGEGLVANGNFSLLDMGNSNTVAVYTTDGTTEPHCFANLPSGNYRITSAVPDSYNATTRSDWDLTLAAGSTANLEFGAQATGETGGTDNGTSNTSDDNNARLVRALLAAAGVVLLLVAAGVAGFLVLTRRR